jgi:transposase-like protein
MPLCPYCSTETNRKWSQYHRRNGQRWSCIGQGCWKIFVDPDSRKTAKIEGLKRRLEKIRPALLLLGLRLSCRQIETATGCSWDSCRRTLVANFAMNSDFTVEFMAKVQADLDSATSDHTVDLYGRLDEWILVHSRMQRSYSVGPLDREKRITPAGILALNSTTAGRQQVSQLLKDVHKLTGLSVGFNGRGELRYQPPGERV